MAYLAKDQAAATVPVHIRPAETERSPEEELAQELYAQRIESEADSITEVGLARAHRDRASVARASLPIAEYLDRLAMIADAERDAGSISGADAIAIRGSYHDSAEKLRSAQLYNPVMQAIVERRPSVPEDFVGPHPDAADLAGLAAARVVLGLDAVKAAVKPSGRPSAEVTEQMVRKELDRQMSLPRNALLRKAVDDFGQSRLGARC